jgi:nicotinate phosphoribosyltransferase
MIIKSMLDTDLYKFTMQQVVFYKFADVNVKYAFKLRNYPKGTLLPYMDAINEEIMSLSGLRMKPEDIDFLRGLSFMHPGYLEFLRYHRMDPERFVKVSEEDGEVKIDITVRG